MNDKGFFIFIHFYMKIDLHITKPTPKDKYHGL